MKSYIVYMHISPNNKRYIGITSQKTSKRWNNGNGYKNNRYFYKAIKKYGWDNFQHIIIARRLNEDETKWLEIELIKKWNTTDSEYGYNISFGGEGTNGLIGENHPWYGRHHKEESKRKISENHANMNGENNPMYGKDWREGKTEEELKEIKEKQFENTPRGEKHPMWGKSRSEETKRKIRETKEKNGTINKNARKVICVTTGEKFNSAKEASDFYNCDSSAILKCCKGKYKSAGKLSNGIKLHWLYLEDYLKGDINNEKYSS